MRGNAIVFNRGRPQVGRLVDPVTLEILLDVGIER